MSLAFYQIAILVFILLSAFFSGSETMIISANKFLIEYQAENNKKGAKRALFILNNVDEVLSMILIGNNIANISAAVFIAYVASEAYQIKNEKAFLVTIVQTLVFLIICEIFPKVIARSKSEVMLKVVSYPLTFFLWIFKPLISIALLITNLLKKGFRFQNSNYSTVKARDEINVLFKMGEKSGVLDRVDNYFVKEILSLHKIKASEVMTPTIDIVSVEINDSIKTVIKLIEKTKFSRIPVFDKRVDNIVGYVYYRDLYDNSNSSIKELMHHAEYIPQTKKIYRLYKEMIQKDKHVVFVVNEFGAVTGLLTREDIAEEIVGEIQTKDHFKEELYSKINSHLYSVIGTLDVEYFDSQFKIGIKKDGFETVAGFVLYQIGKIPRKGEKFIYNNYVFTVEECSEKAVQRVKVKIPKNKKLNL